MSDIIKKVKNIKGLSIIIVLFAAAAIILLFSGSLFGGGSSETSSSGTLDATSLSEYSAAIEERIKALISPLQGVGDARVLVYLSSTEEYVYDGSSRDAKLSKVVSPTVSGVAIVCSGGNDANVRAKVTGLICAVFGVSSNHVFVTGP